jgi:hypothetical protein
VLLTIPEPRGPLISNSISDRQTGLTQPAPHRRQRRPPGARFATHRHSPLAPTGLLLREHVRAPRGWHRIEDADRPARTPRPTLALLARAQHAGAHLHTVCTHTDVRPGQLYTVFSDEELAEIRETIGLKTAEKSLEFWNDPADTVYDNL